GSTGWTKSTPARHPHSAKAPPHELRGKRGNDPGLRVPNRARKKDKQSIGKNIKKADEGPPQPPATPQAEAQGPSGHQRKRQYPRRGQPKKNVQKEVLRKCPSTTKADQPKTTQADRSGSTGWSKTTPARHPHCAKALLCIFHVEIGGKSSCQVSPTITGKGRSAARPNPTRLHWVECNQGERKEGSAAASTES